MAKLSLFEVLDSQLGLVPELDGQLIVVTNTGSIYRDVLINGSINRLLIGNDIIVVDELPLAPISNKIYFLRPNHLYTYNSGWVELNKQNDLTQIQTDWLQADDTKPDFLKNKPFGDDLPVTERFSQADTPNPVRFGSEALDFTGYKISGTTLTQEQIVKGVTVTINGVTENLLSGEMQVLGNVAVLIRLPSGYVYATFAKEGEFVVDPENGISVEVPKAGGYFLLPYGTPLPEGLTIEMSYIGTKKIDQKYLPESAKNTDVVNEYIIPCDPIDINFDFNFNTIPISEDIYNTLNDLSNDRNSTTIGIPFNLSSLGFNELSYMWFHEIGRGSYSCFNGDVILMLHLNSSGGNYNFLTTQISLSVTNVDDVITPSSNNPVTSSAIYQELLKKQETLKFDDSPTAGSDNPVKSGGIKNAIDNANAHTIDGYHIRVVTDEGDTGLDGYITFIIQEAMGG